MVQKKTRKKQYNTKLSKKEEKELKRASRKISKQHQHNSLDDMFPELAGNSKLKNIARLVVRIRKYEDRPEEQRLYNEENNTDTYKNYTRDQKEYMYRLKGLDQYELSILQKALFPENQ